MFTLKIQSIAGMTAEAIIHPHVAHLIGLVVGNKTSIPRGQLLTEFGYPAGVGAKTANTSTQLYAFLNAVLAESNSADFTVQIEAIPAVPKLNPIFNSIETLPEEDRSLILVFTDQEVMSGVMYCKKHDEFHTRKGDVKKHLIHQWAYADDFFAQLNLPEFPQQQPKAKKSKSEQGIPELLKMLLLAAALADEADQENSKKSPIKFH